MAASNNNNAHKPELTLPSSIAQTMRLVQRVAHSATWGERIARHHQPPPAADFGPRLFRRFDAAHAPGQWADAFAQRFVADEFAPSSSPLTLAAHAPAQRQVSAARQGALGWSGGDRFSSPASSFAGGPIDRFADTDASQSLISDLMGNGWGVQSARPDAIRRFAEPASLEPAPPAARFSAAQDSASPAPIHRSPAPTAPVQRQSSDPIHRSPAPQPAAPTPTPATIDRQADVPAAASAEASIEKSATVDPSPVQRSADAAADAPNVTESTAASSESTAPLETASTRPMAFFRGTPSSPLMRMGLSESSGSSDAPAAPATINRQPASGELPVVRPARSSDEPSFSAPTSAAINRRAEQPLIVPSPQITSSNVGEQASSSDRTESGATAEIQRTAIDLPAATTSQPQATSSDSVQPEVQRSAAPESSAPVVDSTINRSEATAPAAVDTPGASTVAQAPVQRSEAPPSEATSGNGAATVAPASVEQTSAASGSAAQTASPSSTSVIARSPSDAAATLQRDATGATDESSTFVSAESVSSAADATTPPESAAPATSAPAQRAPEIQRRPVQPARASSIDTVLPLAGKLLQRYSANSAQGTSAAMPLLRTFAPTTAAVMRSAAPLTTITPATQTGSNQPTSSSASAAFPPLVQRSPIVPLLPSATLQRDPAMKATASASTPALEWSALPLLQRLSGNHALPTSPTAAHPTPGSVAAQVINRLALDQPGAAPMPLLRMHAPSIAGTVDTPATSSAVMRTASELTADGAAGLGSDMQAGQSGANDGTGSASPGFDAQTTVASANFEAAAPAIHRSAILPSLTSAAFQPLTLLRMHVPDAPSMAQTNPTPGMAALQRTPDAPLASPIMQRTADQPSISSPASASGEGAEAEPTSSTASTALPPLVQRSPIVPLLPSATLQRDPAPAPTTAASTPAPRATTTALEWSALPLLQRLSSNHALPASPTAANPAAPDAANPATPAAGSVAAQVINRLALDQPGAAPMPLLRMHVPLEAPVISRDADSAAAENTDSPAQDSAADAPTAPPSVMSALVRRSAILASPPSLAAQAGDVGIAAPPAVESYGVTAQRSPTTDYAMPMLQRTSVQRFFGSRPGLKLPSLGGLQNSVNSLAGQAQGMVGQVTGLPGQLQGQAQGMVGQVTGLPGQLQGQAQGMIDQVTGLPNQLMGQAQGMVDQVTGMPNQLMGQAQGMIDQVTGMPNQLMGQAQGMIDQVTGLPNQLMGQAQGMIDQVTGLPNQLMGQAQGMIDQVTGMPNQLMGQAQGMVDQVSSFPGQMQDAASNLLGGRSSQLTLLRPVRSESQSAPVRDEAEAQGEATTGSSTPSVAGGSTGGAGAQAKGEAGKQGKPDIDMLAQQVYARLRHRLLIDRERLGR